MLNFKLLERERERDPHTVRVCMHAGVCVCVHEEEYLSRRVFVFFLVGLSANGVKTDVQHKSLNHRDAVPPTRTRVVVLCSKRIAGKKVLELLWTVSLCSRCSKIVWIVFASKFLRLSSLWDAQRSVALLGHHGTLTLPLDESSSPPGSFVGMLPSSNRCVPL